MSFFVIVCTKCFDRPLAVLASAELFFVLEGTNYSGRQECIVSENFHIICKPDAGDMPLGTTALRNFKFHVSEVEGHSFGPYRC